MSLVLVADDEPAVLEVLTEVVEDLGHEVVRAHDGREALQLARAQQPRLVVTDHMMPRLSGVELCRAIRGDERLHDVPVILLSAALPPEAIEASAYLAKPFELDEFEALVQRTLDLAPIPAAVRASPAPPPAPVADSAEPRKELIHWVAHELKTPLAAAKINLQLLERRLSANGQPPERHHFQSVTRQLDNLEQIVNTLLDASRLSEGKLALKLEDGDIRPSVERTVARCQDAHPDLQMEVNLPGEPVMVRHDAVRLCQVLANLLSNAVRYGTPPRQVRVEVQHMGALAEVRVQDFGPGLSAAAQKTLFTRFRTPEENVARGHGLGLYIAYELARLHGGGLGVRSLLGQGATFTVTLPVLT